MTGPPAAPAGSRPVDVGALEVWVGFVTGELDQERLRKANIRDRAGQVFRNSGLFFPLITAISALISPGTFSVATQALLFVFALALLGAVGLAVAANWNITSESADSSLMRKIPGVALGSTTAEALQQVTSRYVEDLSSLREANDGIAKRLRWSHVSLAISVVLGFMTVIAAVLA